MNVDKIRFYHQPKETIKVTIEQSWVNCVHTYIVYSPITLLTKIGRSANYENRIQKLENENGQLILIAVFKGDIEKWFHLRYSRYRSDNGREWFNLTKRQLDYIARMK